MAGVALGDTDLKITFPIGAFFLVKASLWNGNEASKLLRLSVNLMSVLLAVV